MFGPEINVPLPDSLVTWAPFETHLEVYATALFGSMDIDGQSTPAQVYAAGLKVLVPVWRPQDFVLSTFLAVGPAYLHTDLGHATGMDLAPGLRGEYSVSRQVILFAQIELDTFWGQGIGAWAPAGTAGIALGF
jgi:hypothetical protein